MDSSTPNRSANRPNHGSAMCGRLHSGQITRGAVATTFFFEEGGTARGDPRSIVTAFSGHNRKHTRHPLHRAKSNDKLSVVGVELIVSAPNRQESAHRVHRLQRDRSTVRWMLGNRLLGLSVEESWRVGGKSKVTSCSTNSFTALTASQ